MKEEKRAAAVREKEALRAKEEEAVTVFCLAASFPFGCFFLGFVSEGVERIQEECTRAQQHCA